MNSPEARQWKLGSPAGRRLRAAILILLLVATRNLFADDSFAWIGKSPCPLARFEAVGGAAAGRLYQFSGYYTLGQYIKATAECDAFDPATNSWQRLADIPQPISHCGQVVDDQNVSDQIFWLAGGFLGDHPGPSTNQVWKYSIKNDTWAAGPPLPDERGGGALTRLNRELHYFGGVIRHTGVYLQDYGTHWVLDLDNMGGGWRTTTTGGQTLAPMPNPRNHMGGVELNGKLYAIGGQHLGNEDTPQSEVDVYDPGTNSWTQAAPMPRPIGHITANVFVRNAKIVITTGKMANGVLLANVIEYDPVTNTWSELSALPDARQSPVSGLVGNQIVVTCGSNSKVKAQTWVSTPIGLLPAPWQDQDIGSVGAAGGASTPDYASSYSVQGSGTGVAGNADSFHYLYQPLNGSGQIVVRVATQQNTGASAQAGLMIRETLDPASKHAAMLITPGNGILFQRRTASGGATSQTVLSGVAAPYWLKLVRSGNTLTGYQSSGGTWIRLASSTVSMGINVFVGLAVASGSDAAISQADFDNLNLGPKADAGPDQSIVLPGTATLTKTTTDDGLPAGTLTYSWRKISGSGTVAFTGTSTSDTIATFSSPGAYVLRLTTSDSGLSATDDVTITANGQSTPTPTPTVTPTPTATPPPGSTVATPKFSLPAGTYPAPYRGTKSMTMSDTTAGSSLRYADDGTVPTATTGTLVSAATPTSTPSVTIELPIGSTTIKALAFKAGLADSAIKSSDYVISP